MMTLKGLLGTVVLLILIGCTASLKPLYTLDDLVFEPGLLGMWEAGETQTTFVGSANRYAMYCTEDLQDLMLQLADDREEFQREESRFERVR